MRYAILILTSFLFLNTLDSQHIGQLGGSLRGSMAFKTNDIQSVPGSFHFKNDFNFFYKNLYLSYPISDKWTVGLDYTRTRGWTGFSLRPEFCSGSCGHSSSRIDLNRYGIYVERKLLDYANIFTASAYVKIMYENALPSGRYEFGELEAVSFWNPGASGPYSEWTVFVQPLQGQQVLPGTAFKLNLRLIWRIYAHFEYGYTLGNRDFQKLYFENNYLGQPGVTGEWSSNGTLQYRIWGLSIKFTGKINRFEKGKFDLF